MANKGFDPFQEIADIAKRDQASKGLRSLVEDMKSGKNFKRNINTSFRFGNKLYLGLIKADTSRFPNAVHIGLDMIIAGVEIDYNVNQRKLYFDCGNSGQLSVIAHPHSLQLAQYNSEKNRISLPLSGPFGDFELYLQENIK